MKAVCVIPARLESVRLPKKLLRKIDGRYLIQYAYENAKKAKRPSRVLAACDHPALKEAVESFGGEAVMTSERHTSGTERVAEVAGRLEAEIFVNLQADEPLMHPSVVDDVISALEKSPECRMATACVRMRDEKAFLNPSVVKVVKNQKDEALYFSRAPIPHERDGRQRDFFKHLGIYAYRRDFLLGFSKLPASVLEAREKLEQLRVLDHGFSIKVLETAYDSVGVDTEEDLKQVERIMHERTAAGPRHA